MFSSSSSNISGSNTNNNLYSSEVNQKKTIPFFKYFQNNESIKTTTTTLKSSQQPDLYNNNSNISQIISSSSSDDNNYNKQMTICRFLEPDLQATANAVNNRSLRAKFLDKFNNNKNFHWNFTSNKNLHCSSGNNNNNNSLTMKKTLTQSLNRNYFKGLSFSNFKNSITKKNNNYTICGSCYNHNKIQNIEQNIQNNPSNNINSCILCTNKSHIKSKVKTSLNINNCKTTKFSNNSLTKSVDSIFVDPNFSSNNNNIDEYNAIDGFKNFNLNDNTNDIINNSIYEQEKYNQYFTYPGSFSSGQRSENSIVISSITPKTKNTIVNNNKISHPRVKPPKHYPVLIYEILKEFGPLPIREIYTKLIEKFPDTFNAIEGRREWKNTCHFAISTSTVFKSYDVQCSNNIFYSYNIENPLPRSEVWSIVPEWENVIQKESISAISFDARHLRKRSGMEFPQITNRSL